MSPLTSKLGSLLSPIHRTTSTSSNQTNNHAIDITSTGRSRVASSCELFALLKALAAGGNSVTNNDDQDHEDDHVDDDEGEGLSPTNTLVDNARTPQDALSAQLAALAMSNLSPIVVKQDDEQSESPVSSGITTPDTPETPEPKQNQQSDVLGTEDIPEEVKLQAIIDDYGDVVSLLEGPQEPERLLAECKGSLFRGLMLIGNLHLTTHRLLFHALLPPDSAMHPAQNPSAQNNDAAVQAVSHQSDVLMSGPITLHSHSRLKPAKRVWMELSTEMITTYPAGDETGRVRPLRSILLSSVQRMSQPDPGAPCDFHIAYATPAAPKRLFFTVDTEQSATQWRRALQSALYRHARRRWKDTRDVDFTEDWSTMRCCLPLDRVNVTGISDYHSFATLVGLHIDLEDQPLPAPILPTSPPATPSRSSSSCHRRENSRSGTETPTTPTTTGETSLSRQLARTMGADEHDVVSTDSRSYAFNVAVLNEQSWFVEALEAAVNASKQRTYRAGAKPPKMILTVAGYDCLAMDDEVTPRSSGEEIEGDEEEEGTGGMSLGIRKAETASMAAAVFGLQEGDPIWLKRCYLINGVVPSRGHIIITSRYVCFWRRASVGADIKYRFPVQDVKGAHTAPSLRAAFHGLALQLHGQGDVRFEFWLKSSRDAVLTRLISLSSQSPSDITPVVSSTSTFASTPRPMTPTPLATDILAPPKDALFQARAFPDEALGFLPFVANKPSSGITRLTPRHFVCLTIGSRGDVQPYIALCLRLKQDGHKVTIVTHDEFKSWIEGYGIGHRQAGGDPTALMKLSAEHKMFSPGFFRESLGSFRQWLDDLLLDSWNSCKDADVLIESPSTMSGIHIAEALRIPYFRAFTMPWTRTTAYPQAFMVPAIEMGPSFNYSTYVLYDNIIWQATSGQINRWRKRHLKLKATDMSALSITKVPFLYNFSPAVVPKPLDWHDDISITGYWNLEDSDTEWTPPEGLDNFMSTNTDKPLVYIGFGSIVVPDPTTLTRNIIAAVEKANVRAIIAKGWSARGGETEDKVEFPASCYSLDKVPHGWLFPKVNAVMHHGGAGTVGASLRAGVPTIIKPWFGDQYFWAIRVTKLGAGLRLNSLKTDDIAEALKRATSDKTMIEKAARVGFKIRSENGVENALQAIHNNIVRAASDRTKMTWAK